MFEEFFGLGLIEHRLWGFIFTPYIIKKSDAGRFYFTSHTIFPLASDGFNASLSPDLQKIVALCDEYSDKRDF
ncbi:MAG: hypothetical protein H6540_07905 [Bacteroidales bacterium]|nr:hypothetical protein [Bacteroidales bacterium]